MSGDESGLRSGPVALSALLDSALDRLRQQDPARDGFLFSGNLHQSVPRALFFDRRLTPLERNAWQAVRLLLDGDGPTVLATYDRLHPFLATAPGARQASHETVARALTLLRLTRWLSLVRRRRDGRSGRILGNLYVLHDESLSPFEAIRLDAGYLELVGHALAHAAKAVRVTGLQALREVTEDPQLDRRALPGRLQVLAQRMAADGWVAGSCPQHPVGSHPEEGRPGALRNRGQPSSEPEAGPRPAPDGLLRIRGAGRTVSCRSMEVRRPATALNLPQRFLALEDQQQRGALLALRKVDAGQRQAVLDEWAARCATGSVRNPAGYLFGIIQKALRGEFRIWAGRSQHSMAGPPGSPRPVRPSGPAGAQMVQVHLDRLRSRLRDGQ